MLIVTRAIDNVFNTNHADRFKLQEFATYYRTYWLPLKEIISVYDKPIKTNNTCENFHLYALKSIGNRSNVYKMLCVYKIIPSFALEDNYRQLFFKIIFQCYQRFSVIHMQFVTCKVPLQMECHN